MKLRLLILAILATLLPLHMAAFAASPTVIASPAPTPVPTFQGEHRQYLVSETNAVVSASAVNYFAPVGQSAPAAVGSVGATMGSTIGPGHVRNMYCWLSTVTGVPTVAGGTSYVIALIQQSLSAGTVQAPTALTCTIGATAVACSDVVDDIYLNPGDAIAYSVTPSGTPTTLVVHCTSELDN